MLTEKAIKDHAQCPSMWKDHPGNEKRVKADRAQDPSLEELHKALTSGISNKRCLAERKGDGYHVVPYEDSIWLVVPTDGESLLLAINEVTLEKVRDNWTITVLRKQQRRPLDEDKIYAETMVRRVLARAFKELFPRMSIKVETQYQGISKAEVTQDPTAENLQEAYDFMDEIRDTMMGDMKIEPRTDKCQFCWWKECPDRKNTPEDPGIS